MASYIPRSCRSSTATLCPAVCTLVAPVTVHGAVAVPWESDAGSPEVSHANGGQAGGSCLLSDIEGIALPATNEEECVYVCVKCGQHPAEHTQASATSSPCRTDMVALL